MAPRGCCPFDATEGDRAERSSSLAACQSHCPPAEVLLCAENKPEVGGGFSAKKKCIMQCHMKFSLQAVTQRGRKGYGLSALTIVL